MLPVSSAQIAKLYQQATALHQSGRLQEADSEYQRLERLAPNLAELPYQRGRLALQRKAPEAARAHLERARALKPDEPAILIALAEALGELREVDAALVLHDQLIAHAPKSVKPRADKALLLQRVGRFDEAEVEFRKALKLAPKDGELYRIFLGTKKLKKGDPLIRAMQKAWADRSVQGRSRVHLGYALAKAMEDSGQANRVFSYLRPANDLLKKAQSYDLRERLDVVEGLMAAFDGASFDPLPEGPDGFAPIFVTGMPRSGTTLVEQIIASHSEVTGGGELTIATRLVEDLMGKAPNYTSFATLSDDALAGFARLYHDAVRAKISFGRYLTDKSIQSHLFIGLLLRAIPAARVIVVRRDPRDLGLSIYKNFFGETSHQYATDLETIGRYTATFERMIEFWRARIPGRFHEISYDALVAEPEAQSRALIAAAGLDWDPACLNFHQNTRRVDTLSLHQVRQPIYASSRQAWKAHESDLAPLIGALSAEGVI